MNASDGEVSASSSNHDRITNRTDYSEFLKADLEAHGLLQWHWYMRFKHPEIHYQRVLRRVEYYASSANALTRIAWSFARLYLARLSVQTGISIPPGVFGRGLAIAHYGSIVVNDKARVGKYCRIHSATNIGIGKNGAPIIGDFVYIGPGAVISGGIQIGSRSAVGANAVLLTDIPPQSIAVGVPAKAISNRSSFGAMPEAIQLVMGANAD